jgi:hypothetical protein
MNVTDYTYLINKPDAITEKQADALGSVLNEFPYFQSARALRLKGLYNQNSFKYNYALKVTAAHTTDRSVLFDFITSETFTTIQSEYYDQKLKDLLEINVFDSQIISPEEIRKIAEVKIPEVRIDPIEKSILDSIKEATAVSFEQPSIIEEPKIDSLIEEPILTSEKEDIIATYEEPAQTEEPEVKESDLIAIEEDSNVTFEETAKIEGPRVEETDLTYTRESLNVTFERPSIIEETNETEEDDVTAIEENSTVAFEETSVIEEPKVEETDLTYTGEALNVTFEEPSKIEEQETEPIIETPISIPAKVATSTFFEETVDDEIPEIRIDPIEESVYISLKEASTVVFEEAKVDEVPQIIEDSEKTEEPKETEEIKQAEEPEISEEPEVEIPETVRIAEEHLEIGKPLDFSVNEKHSFQEWLQLAKTEPIDRSEEEEEKKNPEENIDNTPTEKIIEVKQIPKPIIENTVETIVDAETVEEEKKKKAELIDKFIETNPKISPIKQTAINTAVQFDINKEDNSYLMTETLARVYLEQKKYTKAIQAYEILILKYPEKISFFADRISDIKILQQNNNNN